MEANVRAAEDIQNITQRCDLNNKILFCRDNYDDNRNDDVEESIPNISNNRYAWFNTVPYCEG